jgi:hypothetical protein
MRPRHDAYLWIAALTKYVRCFTTGRRLGLSESLLAEIDGAVEAHRYYKNMRDKNVAHSVNPFEEVRVGVVLPSSDSPIQAVQGVAIITRRLASGSIGGVSTLRRLAAEVHAKTNLMAEAAQNDLLAWAKQQPLESFVRGPLGIVTPSSEQAGRAR